MFYERCETPPSEISPAAEGDQPVALFLLHQSRRGRVSDRRVAGDVRAGQRPPRRDLPDLRHHQARRRRDLGLRADPEAAQLEEGRVRADHVLRRRPQRQEPGLRAGLGAGHRPPPDRDVFAPDPHRRPHRGAAARRHGRLRRVPVARLGGHRHRRAETVGDALHRAEREEPARLVWRGDRHGAFQRRPEHRPDAAHHPHQGRHRRGARRRHAALRFHPAGRRSRNRTEGLRHDLRHPRRHAPAIRGSTERSTAQRRRRRQHPARRPRGFASSTRSPTISARPAPTSRRCARRCPTRCSTG